MGFHRFYSLMAYLLPTSLFPKAYMLSLWTFLVHSSLTMEVTMKPSVIGALGADAKNLVKSHDELVI